ncbi:MAG: hypothetical protein QOI03_2345 [Solirubrobacteraceae bacterium]|jgi:hypothetical protein|nr:hypothetical protein [Solirubrobacteraceae bacterium]
MPTRCAPNLPRDRARRSSALLGASLAALALALAAGGSQAAAGPHGHQARSCHAPRYPGLGYFTSLTVSGVSCSTGSQVAVAYYHCRTRSGVSGRCHGRVLGYTCSEKRNSIPTEIDARVSCRSGGKTVTHTFQQNT